MLRPPPWRYRNRRTAAADLGHIVGEQLARRGLPLSKAGKEALTEFLCLLLRFQAVGRDRLLEFHVAGRKLGVAISNNPASCCCLSLSKSEPGPPRLVFHADPGFSRIFDLGHQVSKLEKETALIVEMTETPASSCYPQPMARVVGL